MRETRLVLITAAVTLAAAALLALALVVVDAARTAAVAVQVGAHFLVGRETGIPVGLTLATPRPLVALVAFLQDTLVLVVGYAVVLLAADRARSLPLVGRIANRLQKRDPRRVARSEPVAVALLAASIWIPFLPTGALAAALAGRALGYRTVALLPSLVLSIALASVFYTWLFAAALASATTTQRVLLALGVGLLAGVIAYVTRERSSEVSSGDAPR